MFSPQFTLEGLPSCLGRLYGIRSGLVNSERCDLVWTIQRCPTDYIERFSSSGP